MDTNIVLLNQGYDQTFQAREQRLIDILSTYDELVVSFSGRLESCYAMDLCRASGTRIRALTLDNPLLSRRELARAHRYCQRYNIEQRVLKTDEMLFCDIEQPPKVAKDPVRFIDEAKAKQVDWDHLPLLIPASLEEMQAYLGRFHQPPPRTLWLFAREECATGTSGTASTSVNSSVGARPAVATSIAASRTSARWIEAMYR